MFKNYFEYFKLIGPDAADVEALRVQIEELNKKLEEATSRADEAEAKVAELQVYLNFFNYF